MKFSKVIAIGAPSQLQECETRSLPEGVTWTFWNDGAQAVFPLQADALFLLDEHTVASFPYHQLDENILVFVHDICQTLDAYPTGLSVIRMNAWPGFTGGPLLELAATDGVRKKANTFLDTLDWKREWVPDIPGMIRPRVLAMIINEACFALAENVSTREEIDTAMKLGTNYPFGPFEWAERIGPDRIFILLQALSRGDTRYQPAPGMLKLLKQTA